MERWLSWLKAPDSKSDVGATLPWVQIPLSPPMSNFNAPELLQLRSIYFLSTTLTLKTVISEGIYRTHPHRCMEFLFCQVSL